MKRFAPLLLLLVCIALGLIVGRLIRAGSGLALSSSAGSQSAASSTSSPNSCFVLEAPVSVGLVERLEHDLAMSSGVTRWLYWMEAIEKAPLAEFPRLARLAGNDERALRLIAQRWLDLEPKDLFAALRTAGAGDTLPVEALGEILVEEWSKRDPAALAATLHEASPFGLRDVWRRNAADEIMLVDPELGLRLFVDWGIGGHTPGMRGVRKWTAADPRHAAEFTFAIPASIATGTMEVIGEEWAKIDPKAGLEFATGKNNLLGKTLASSILQVWAQTNLVAATEWLFQSDPATRNRLSAPVVEEWAKRDAGQALAWCQENLTGSSLAAAAASVLKGAAQKDPTSAARLVTAMPPSSARSAAAVEVALKLLPNSMTKTFAARPEALAWLRDLDPDATGRILDRMVWSWAEADVRSMTSFLSTTPVESLPSSAYVIAGRVLARLDPLEAMDWANNLPEARRLDGGSDAFANWCQSQPEAAMQWLQRLPQNDARRAPFLETAITYLAYEDNGAERLAALPLVDRAALRTILQTADIPADRRSRLLKGFQ